VEERIRTLHAPAFPPELRKERFDVVIAKDIVEHVEDDQQLLADLGTCQNPGGLLLVSTQNCRSLNYLVEGSYQKYWCGNEKWCGWDPTHLRFYSPASLTRKLVRAGYRVQRWASVYIVPYNILSWLFLLKLQVELPALHHFDLVLGRVFPFNRMGWKIIVCATRDS
jgi:2-polyprenyl-6-hydroxyphenyl methylase/3-demethylubiquinone-9 3-methyltransferase